MSEPKISWESMLQRVPSPPNTREGLLALMDRRKEMEQELKELHDYLESQGGVGMLEPLVDSEEYPRSDVDILGVRTARRKVICLQNDLNGIMKDIEAGLIILHESSRKSNGGGAKRREMYTIQENSSPPFMKIGDVTSGSPADDAGLRPGELVISFGRVTHENFKSLTDIAEEVEISVNQQIRVEVKDSITNENRVRLLKPRTWAGRGLLGCQILPLLSDDLAKRN